MNFYIITNRLYNFENKRFNLGGVETYIQGLYSLIEEKGHFAKIIQMCDCEKEFEVTYNGFNVLIIPFKKSIFKSLNQITFDSIHDRFKDSDSYFIISTDQQDICSDDNHVIQIQHGIAFDVPGDYLPGFWRKNSFLQHFNKLLKCIKNIRRLYHAKNTVCVDYNFYNWFRTLGTIYSGYNIKVIPNYSSSFISDQALSLKLNSTDSKIRIVFARRFFDYRGTLIMIEASREILKRFKDIEIVFAGDGPLKSNIEENFKNDNRVAITTFSPEDSVQFHKKFDIAVVPTIYSEGTSLSLCEAMSAGCVPIATHVGGMSNMILNNYNGFLIQPTLDALKQKLIDVILMSKADRNVIAKNAYDTALCSFSVDRWNKEWADFLNL